MPYPTSVRTPAHFGTLSLFDAIELEAAPATNFDLASYFNSLHLAQGIMNSNIDLVGRVPRLASLRSDLVDRDALHVNLRAYLLSTYAEIFSTYEPLRPLINGAPSTSSVSCNRKLSDQLFIDTYNRVNDLFSKQIALWNKSVKAVDMANLVVTKTVKDSTDLTVALEELEKAVRVDRNIDKAERKVAKAEQDLLKVNACMALLDIELSKFNMIREELAPLRLLEDVSRSLKLLLFVPEVTSVDYFLDVVNIAFGRIAAFYPERFPALVEYGDNLLESYFQ